MDPWRHIGHGWRQREGDAQWYPGLQVGLRDESLAKIANTLSGCHTVRLLKPDRWAQRELWENTRVLPWNDTGIRQWRPLQITSRTPSSHTIRQHEQPGSSQEVCGTTEL